MEVTCVLCEVTLLRGEGRNRSVEHEQGKGAAPASPPQQPAVRYRVGRRSHGILLLRSNSAIVRVVSDSWWNFS